MESKQILKRRLQLTEFSFTEEVIWKLPQPVPGSQHEYKYRLAYVVHGECVLRYDNETGKGDHKHTGETEVPVEFTTWQQLITDFKSDIQRWNDENGYP